MLLARHRPDAVDALYVASYRRVASAKLIGGSLSAMRGDRNAHRPAGDLSGGHAALRSRPGRRSLLAPDHPRKPSDPQHHPFNVLRDHDVLRRHPLCRGNSLALRFGVEVGGDKTWTCGLSWQFSG